MPLLLRKNFARGQLASGIADDAAQMTITAGHTLPTDAGDFPLVIWDWTSYQTPLDDPNVEIVLASYSGTPNVYDITRAQEDTDAATHSADVRVALFYTAGMSLDDLSVHTHAIYHTDSRAATWLAANHETTYTHADIASNVSDIVTNVTAIGLNTTHRGMTSGNPHSVSASDVSLGNVSNVATDDTAYNATSWNANTDAATKNVIRDKVETMDTAIGLNTTHKSSDGSDHIFLDQSVVIAASPTFAGATITGASVLGLNSVVFQPAAGGDSTTFLQVLDAAGVVVGNWNTTNKWLGIGGRPSVPLHIMDFTGEGIKFQLNTPDAGFRITTAPDLVTFDTYASDDEFAICTHHGEIIRFTHQTMYVGIGEKEPETLLELTRDSPTITGHCDTHSDALNARAVTYQAFGEQSGGEETTLGKWTFAHDSAADDENAYWKLFINTGSDGDSPTEALEIGSDLLATFAGSIVSANYTAANLLTACATNAGGLDFTAASKTLSVDETETTSNYHTDARSATWLAANHETTYTHADIASNTTHRGLTSGNPHSVTPTELSLVIGTDVQAHGDVLDDLNTLGIVGADSEFLVGTTAGVYAYESGATVRISLGLGTGDSPQFANLGVGRSATQIGDFYAGSGAVGVFCTSASLTEGDASAARFVVNATGNSLTRGAQLGSIYYDHSGGGSGFGGSDAPAGYLALVAGDGVTNYLWTDNNDYPRISANITLIGSTNAPLVGQNITVSSGAIARATLSNSVASGEASRLVINATANAATRGAQIGSIYYDQSAAGGSNAPCGYIALVAGDGVTSYLWLDNVDKLRISSAIGHIGSTNGAVIGDQAA